jgi:tRNA 2-selenouridine synthase SelU
MENNIDEKVHIAGMMSQVLEILDMISSVKVDDMRVILNTKERELLKDNKKGDYINSFLLQGGMTNNILKIIEESLKSRLSELEMNYFSLKNKGTNI